MARQMALLQVHQNIAGPEMKAVGPNHLDRAVDRNALRIDIVAALIGGDQKGSFFEIEAGKHAANIDQRRVGALLDGAVGPDRELLPFVVGTGVAGGLDSHPFGRALHFLLVQDEAHVALLVERGERQEGHEHADRGGERDLGPPDQPVMAAAGLGPALLHDRLGGPSISHRARKYPVPANRQGRGGRVSAGNRSRPGQARSALRGPAVRRASP